MYNNDIDGGDDDDGFSVLQQAMSGICRVVPRGGFYRSIVYNSAKLNMMMTMVPERFGLCIRTMIRSRQLCSVTVGLI